jgi:hypothetical protein
LQGKNDSAYFELSIIDAEEKFMGLTHVKYFKDEYALPKPIIYKYASACVPN